METWSGTWTLNGPGDGGCNYTDDGNLTFNFLREGTSFAGTCSVDGIMLRYIPSCEFAFYTASEGSVSGNISSNHITGNFSFTVSETGGGFSITLDGNIVGNTMSGSLTTGARSGTFSLTRE
jgi:hypothetical protein